MNWPLPKLERMSFRVSRVACCVLCLLRNPYCDEYNILCLLTNLISLKIDNKEIGRQFPALDSSPDLKNGTNLAVLSLAGKEPEDTETLKT